MPGSLGLKIWKAYPKAVGAGSCNMKQQCPKNKHLHWAFALQLCHRSALHETLRGNSLRRSESVLIKRSLGIVFVLATNTEAQRVLWRKRRLIPKPDTTYSRNNARCSVSRDELKEWSEQTIKRLEVPVDDALRFQQREYLAGPLRFCNNVVSHPCGGRGMTVKLARGRENTACTFIKWAWSQMPRQVFIVAPHFNVLLALQNNTTLKLRGGGKGKKTQGRNSGYPSVSQMKSYP